MGETDNRIYGTKLTLRNSGVMCSNFPQRSIVLIFTSIPNSLMTIRTALQGGEAATEYRSIDILFIVGWKVGNKDEKLRERKESDKQLGLNRDFYDMTRDVLHSPQILYLIP